MAFDTHSVLAFSSILSVGSQSSTTLVVTLQSGDGARFSTNQQIMIWPNGVMPVMSNAMIGRVTGKSSDTLTIDITSGNREGTSQITVSAGMLISNPISPKILTDIETAINTNATDIATNTASVTTINNKLAGSVGGVTLASPTFTGTVVNPKLEGAGSATQFPQVVGEYDNGNSGAAITIDFSKGDRQHLSVTSNTTLSFSNAVKGQTVILRIVEDATGSHTITVPSGLWPNGAAGTFTTTANAINLLAVYFDGTNYLYQLSPGFA